MSQRCLHDTSTRDVLLSHSGIDIVSWTAGKIGYKWFQHTRPKHGNQSQPAVPCGNGACIAYIHLWLRPNMVHLLIAHLQIFGESHAKRRDPSKNSNYYTWKTKCCNLHALVHELHYASLCKSTNIALINLYDSFCILYIFYIYICHLCTYSNANPLGPDPNQPITKRLEMAKSNALTMAFLDRGSSLIWHESIHVFWCGERLRWIQRQQMDSFSNGAIQLNSWLLLISSSVPMLLSLLLMKAKLIWIDVPKAKEKTFLYANALG